MKYMEPVRIIKCENCINEERLLQGNPCQAGADIGDCMYMRKGGYILLDFGKELNGGVTITTIDVSARVGKYRIVYGESVMEALSCIGEKNSTNNHSTRDMIVEVNGWSTMTFGETGFRFVKVEAIDSDFKIKAIKAKTAIRDLPYIGSFVCNDERLNEIWRVGAYTVQLNMQDYLWDGIKRDRLVWIGDMHPEVSTIRTVFGDHPIVKKSLDFVRDLTPEGSWMNGILTYSMWWVIIQHDWYMHYGDFGYLNSQHAYLKSVVRQAFEWIDSNYSFDGIRMFLDWSSRGLEDEAEGIKAVFCLGLKCAARIFEFLNDEEYSKRCLVYLKKVHDDRVLIETNKRVSALLTLAEKEYPNAEKWLADNSAEEMSCFMGYYVLLAKAKRGQYEEALNIIREYWGGMLDMGATTFWEDFDIKWMENSVGIDKLVPEGKNDIHGDFGRHCYQQFRHSLCHGWASGPTAFLSECLAGIEILEPGCRKLKINPKLAGLKWYNVVYPTPYGSVEIKCRNKNGDTETEISAPPQIATVM